AGALPLTKILVVYDVGGDDGSPHVVSEILEGGTLRGRLREGALPLGQGLGVGGENARRRARPPAHRKPPPHLQTRKPVLTHEGTVKILDFGLAKMIGLGEEGPSALHTQAGTVMGTIGYMSPEQVRGQAVDGRSDLFSLGAVLYEMLTGKRAFRGESAAD